MAFSLQARVVFPVDGPPIEFGVVTIDAGRIVDVGATTHGKTVTDLGSVALLPGFVNAHTHLEFSHMKQPLGQPGMSLVDWIRIIIAERSSGRQSPAASLADGVRESHRSGVATIGNITTNSEKCDADVIQFHEVIGFSRARAGSAREALVHRLGEPSAIPCSRQGISPHAPYTVSPALLTELVELVQRNHLPMAMHLAESREELELLSRGTGPFKELLEERSMWDAGAIPAGSRPLHYLQMLAESPRALVIHGNYLDEEELRFLGEHRGNMSLVYCPRTHAYFFHSPYPLGQALAAGVRVALGTDSRASNPDLSLLEEMRQVARAHPQIDPQEILRMGTLAGAEALGRRGGGIRLGQRANLVAIPVTAGLLATPDEILAEIFAASSVPSAVYLAGRALDSNADFGTTGGRQQV